MKKRIGTFVGLIIVTALALTIAIVVTTGGWGRTARRGEDIADSVIPPAPVEVMKVQRESIEITDTYSGMIRPLERFSLGFEIAGRVKELGTNQEGEPLDDGDRVAAGQVLARLDDRALRARLDAVAAQLNEARARIKDAKARSEKAQSDLRRSTELKRGRSGAITEAQYQNDVTQVAVTDAQLAMAEAQLALAEAEHPTAQKNLEDATLLSPVPGVIAKRLVNAGESVNPQQVIMEIIQVDQVLLVVGVPEAYVADIRVGQVAHTELLARDRFRRRRPYGDGRVYRVAEAADQTTGLFEVEILLDNSQGCWKPGLIALAHIVVEEIQGYRVPMSCAVFRDRETFLYAVLESDKAHRFNLFSRDERGNLQPRWIEQDADLVLPRDWVEQGPDRIVSGLASRGLRIVRRGQHRLVEGRDLTLVELPDVADRGH